MIFNAIYRDKNSTNSMMRPETRLCCKLLVTSLRRRLYQINPNKALRVCVVFCGQVAICCNKSVPLIATSCSLDSSPNKSTGLSELSLTRMILLEKS